MYSPRNLFGNALIMGCRLSVTEKALGSLACSSEGNERSGMIYWIFSNNTFFFSHKEDDVGLLFMKVWIIWMSFILKLQDWGVFVQEGFLLIIEIHSSYHLFICSFIHFATRVITGLHWLHNSILPSCHFFYRSCEIQTKDRWGWGNSWEDLLYCLTFCEALLSKWEPGSLTQVLNNGNRGVTTWSLWLHS